MEFNKVKLGEIVDLRQGFAINKKSNHHISNTVTNLPLLRIGDMRDKKWSVYVKDTIPPQFIAQTNDLIYTRTGAVGLVYRKQYGVIHNNCFTVTPKDENFLSRDYLYFCLQDNYVYETANRLAIGSAQPDLSHNAFKSIEISLPPLPVQRRIASILSNYDDLIENYQRQIKLLEESAQRIYKEWFVDFRLPGHENAKFIDGLPEGWEKKKIGEIAETLGGGTPSTKIQEYWNGNVKWVTPTDLTSNNCLPLIDIKGRITEEGLRKSSAKLLPPYTILMTSRASIGYFALCAEPVCTNQGFISIIPNKDFYRMYIIHNLKTRKDEIISKANGSTFLEISKGKFRDMRIIIPDESVLKKFDEIVEKLFKEELNFSIQIRNLREARNVLLPKLMNGEIEVE